MPPTTADKKTQAQKKRGSMAILYYIPELQLYINNVHCSLLFFGVSGLLFIVLPSAATTPPPAQ